MIVFLIIQLVILFLAFIGIATILNIINSFIKQEKFDAQILFSLLIGLFPALLYLFLFQNNPIRWLLAVRKYEQRKVVFKQKAEEINEIHSLLKDKV